jgi:hypothetical protein
MSRRDQVVTQWKSLVSSTCSSAMKSSHDSFCGASHAPSMVSDQSAVATTGCAPRSSTGHFRVSV